MEDGLVHNFSRSQWRYSPVLILVVVEDGLVPMFQVKKSLSLMSLNPCCSGRWSRTSRTETEYTAQHIVLILVVVEDGLVRSASNSATTIYYVLILVVVEDGLVQLTILRL